MKEYAIFQRIGEGCPFYLKCYSSFEQAKQALMIIISDYDYKRKVYYIDNDFFENRYPLGLNKQIYFQIQERKVTEWTKANEVLNFYSDNIINFPKNY